MAVRHRGLNEGVDAASSRASMNRGNRHFTVAAGPYPAQRGSTASLSIGFLAKGAKKGTPGHVAPRHRFRLDIGPEWSVVRVMRTRPKNDAQPILPEAIAAEVERLAGLPPKELREAWAAQFRLEPPKGLWPDLLLEPWPGGSRRRLSEVTTRPH